MNAPRIGELFSGYGGLGMGVQAVYGGTVAWHSDICRIPTKDNPATHYEPHRGACRILAHRYPGVPNLGDVTTVDWSTVEPIDILTGGSPCQDLSHAGRRAGMTEGTRSNLWVAMREAIAQLRPTTVVWENVRGAYSAAADSELESRPGLLDRARRRDGEPVLRALGRVLGDLSDLGYDCRWHGLRAADVGAAHGRFRVFVVATDTREVGRFGRTSLVGAGWQEAIRSQASSDPCDGSSALLPTPRATDGTKGGPNQRGSSGDLMLPSAVALLPTPTAQEPGGTVEQYRARWLKSDGRDSTFVPLSMAVNLLPTPTVQDGSNVAGPSQQDRNSIPLNAINQWGDYAVAITRWEQALGRPAPAPTMPSSKGNPQLSPVFVEWLMGLPAGWVTDVPGITRNEALKALGNGVVPQQAAAALRVMASWEVAA